VEVKWEAFTPQKGQPWPEGYQWRHKVYATDGWSAWRIPPDAGKPIMFSEYTDMEFRKPMKG